MVTFNCDSCGEIINGLMEDFEHIHKGKQVRIKVRCPECGKKPKWIHADKCKRLGVKPMIKVI